MNQYELAILRVLLKSAAPLSKSKVVNGFSDDSLDFVLSAISDLKQANFIAGRDEGSGDETLELVKERKKDVLSLINPKMPEDNTRDAKTDSKGRGTMWITATLVIVGALTSVYIAYAMGVNDRIAAGQQLVQQYPVRDVTFKVVHLPDGKAVGILAGSMPDKQLAYKSLDPTVLATPPSDAFVYIARPR